MDAIEAIRSRMSELAASLQKVSTAAYQAASPTGGDGNGTGGGEGGAPEGEAADAGAGSSTEEEPVEGEFKEV